MRDLADGLRGLALHAHQVGVHVGGQLDGIERPLGLARRDDEGGARQASGVKAGTARQQRRQSEFRDGGAGQRHGRAFCCAIRTLWPCGQSDAYGNDEVAAGPSVDQSFFRDPAIGREGWQGAMPVL